MCPNLDLNMHILLAITISVTRDENYAHHIRDNKLDLQKLINLDMVSHPPHDERGSS